MRVLIVALIVAGGVIGWMVAPDYSGHGHADEWAHTGVVDQWAADNAH